MTRLLADLACIALVVLSHLATLFVWAWRAWREGVAEGTPAYRAALHWDLMQGALYGSDEGETVSTLAARKRPARLPCLLCRLLSVRWRNHCDDADGVLFITVRTRRTTTR